MAKEKTNLGHGQVANTDFAVESDIPSSTIFSYLWTPNLVPLESIGVLE